MSPDPEDLVARIASFKTPESCEQFAKNVEARGKEELAQLARRRAIEIRAEQHGATTAAERDALEAVLQVWPGSATVSLYARASFQSPEAQRASGEEASYVLPLPAQ